MKIEKALRPGAADLFRVRQRSRALPGVLPELPKKRKRKRGERSGSESEEGKTSRTRRTDRRILVPGIRKTDFYEFSGNFYEKNQEYGNLE